jgi:hypothetical protein
MLVTRSLVEAPRLTDRIPKIKERFPQLK